MGEAKKGGRKGRKKKHIFRGDPNYYNIQNNLLVDKGKEGVSDGGNVEICEAEIEGKVDEFKKPVYVAATSAGGVQGAQNGQSDMKILDN